MPELWSEDNKFTDKISSAKYAENNFSLVFLSVCSLTDFLHQEISLQFQKTSKKFKAMKTGSGIQLCCVAHDGTNLPTDV